VHCPRQLLPPQEYGAQETVCGAAQAAELPLHFCAALATPIVQFAVRQVTAFVANTSFGHAAAFPAHFSAMSQGPADARHSTVFALNASVGQVALVPSHDSATSHVPAAGRQTAPLGCLRSAGQATETPSQLSATSQLLAAAARHTVPDLDFASAGQAADDPLHTSAGSHTPCEARQTVFAAKFVQIPGEPGRLQAWQSLASPPPQAVLQHMPSTQLPLVH
jgi:hypothetical protein